MVDLDMNSDAHTPNPDHLSSPRPQSTSATTPKNLSPYGDSQDDDRMYQMRTSATKDSDENEDDFEMLEIPSEQVPSSSPASNSTGHLKDHLLTLQPLQRTAAAASKLATARVSNAIGKARNMAADYISKDSTPPRRTERGSRAGMGFSDDAVTVSAVAQDSVTGVTKISMYNVRAAGLLGHGRVRNVSGANADIPYEKHAQNEFDDVDISAEESEESVFDGDGFELVHADDTEQQPRERTRASWKRDEHGFAVSDEDRLARLDRYRALLEQGRKAREKEMEELRREEMEGPMSW